MLRKHLIRDSSGGERGEKFEKLIPGNQSFPDYL